MNELQDPIAAAKDMAFIASERDPREEKYGLICADDSEATRRLSVMWFGTREEVSDYLLQSFAVLACEERSRFEVQQVAESLTARGLDAKALQRLNALAGGGLSLIWSGSYDDLCRAEGEVPRMIVEWFRQSAGGAGARPVGQDEQEAFAEFLADLKDSP